MSERAGSTTIATLAVALLAACAPAGKSGTPDAAPGSFVVKTETLVVRHGELGFSGHRATYVLVDVENRSPEDRLISIEATLRDPSGGDLGLAGPDEMRVPKGATRTFALARVGEAKMAAGATVRVRVATAVTYPEPFVVENARLEQGTVRAKVKNVHDRRGLANVVASFHDDEGHILGRPWTRVDLSAGQSTDVAFSAPAKATRFDVYVVESLF